MNRRRFLAAAIGSLFAPAAPSLPLPLPAPRLITGEIGWYEGIRFIGSFDHGAGDKSVVTYWEKVETGPGKPFFHFVHTEDYGDLR